MSTTQLTNTVENSHLRHHQSLTSRPGYLRDTLQFLSRQQVEGCRMVSYAFDYLICTTPPGRLPRWSKHELCFYTAWPSNYANIDLKTGYLLHPQQHKYHELKGVNCQMWATAQSPNLVGCCQEELREASHQLVGQLIYENKAPDVCVEIVMGWHSDDRHYGGHYWNCFIARNQMTEASSFGLLHFFHHLRDVGIWGVSLETTWAQDGLDDRHRLDIELNRKLPEILTLPSPDRRTSTVIPCTHLYAPLKIGDERKALNFRLTESQSLPLTNLDGAHNTQLDVSDECHSSLTSLARHFRCQHFDCADLQEEDQLDAALQLIATGTKKGIRNSLQISVNFKATSAFIDRIVHYFREVPSLRRAIPSTHFNFALAIDKWPEACPVEECLYRRHPILHREYYECIFTNTPSKRRFRLELMCSNGPLRNLTLCFD